MKNFLPSKENIYRIFSFSVNAYIGKK